MVENYGDFKMGTSVKDIEGKTYDELFDGILFPTIYPTYQSPSAQIALKNYSKIQLVGSEAPSIKNFTCTYNPGSININGVKQNERGGKETDESTVICVNNDTLPTTVGEGNTHYIYKAYYEEGPQPKDNKGNNYDEPLNAGNVESSAVYVNGTYPWYINVSGELKEQSLIEWSSNTMSTGEFSLQPHSTIPQQFQIPRQLKSL